MSIYSGLTLVTNAVSSVISLGGSEVNNSRRYADLVDIEAARVQFAATLSISVRVEYSLDAGITWATLVPEDSYVGSNPYISQWMVIPEEARANDVLLRALVIGTGLLTTVVFVEMSFR